MSIRITKEQAATSMHINSLILGGICGILLPVVVLVSIWCAIRFAPWFSWTTDSLSDLAGLLGERPIWTARGLSSIIFNGSLVLVGIITIILALGLGKLPVLTQGIGRWGYLFFLFGACILVMIGIFPKTLGYIHSVFSTPFFLVIPTSILLVGISEFRVSSRFLGSIIIALGIIGHCRLYIGWLWSGAAIPSMISILAMATFAFIFGIKLLRESADSNGVLMAYKGE